MNLEGAVDSASRFAAFVEKLTSVIGHADRARPLNDYCAGLLATDGRRSVEPIAAVTAPAEASCSIKGCCILLPMRRGRTSQRRPKCARWLSR